MEANEVKAKLPPPPPPKQFNLVESEVKRLQERCTNIELWIDGHKEYKEVNRLLIVGVFFVAMLALLLACC